jgi:hypothetical protein
MEHSSTAIDENLWTTIIHQKNKRFHKVSRNIWVLQLMEITQSNRPIVLTIYELRSQSRTWSPRWPRGCCLYNLKHICTARQDILRLLRFHQAWSLKIATNTIQITNIVLTMPEERARQSLRLNQTFKNRRRRLLRTTILYMYIVLTIRFIIINVHPPSWASTWALLTHKA